MSLHCAWNSHSPPVNMEDEALGTCCSPRYRLVRAGNMRHAQLVPFARLFALDRPSQARARLSTFSWCLLFAIFLFKSKLKVTWGQCGRKVLMLGKNMAIFFVFLLGSCEHVVGELMGIPGADVCK